MKNNNKENRTAILAYLLAPVVVPIVLLSRRYGEFERYHARQALGLLTTAIGLLVAWLVIGWLLAWLPVYGFVLTMALFAALASMWFLLFILGIVGIMRASDGRQIPLPVVGEIVERVAGSGGKDEA